MRKIAKYKKGSSLVLILIVMSVLMIFGTAMSSLALSSYKFRSLEQNKKTSLYASEAGLDEAYEVMGKFVQYGIQQGNKAVEEYDKNFESLIKVERYKVEHGKISDYIDEDGIITNSTVEDDRKMVFEEGYKVSTTQSSIINYIEDGVKQDINCYDKIGSVIEKGYKDFIETGLSSGQGIFKQDDKLSQGGMDNLIKELNGYPYQINVALNDKKEVNAEKITEKFNGNNPVTIRVQSSYTHNLIPKIIKATYEINIAKYNVQYNLLPTQIVKIPKNPMWSKALMVNGNMRINAGNVIIGNKIKPDDPNNTGIYVAGKETGEQAGIDLNNESSILKVTGNVVTNKNLILSYDGENTSANSNVDVTGNIYARNIIIDKSNAAQENVTSELEAKGGKISTNKIDDNIRNGSVYIMDDMEINAEKSKVAIAGSYYGVSDGSEGERNTADNSSAIIINTEDIGNRVDEKNNTSTLTIGKNVYIAGTSYISLLNKIKYQTGESISIVGNYRAYTESLPYSSINSSADLKFKDDNVSFDYLDPLTLVTRYNKNEGVVLGSLKAIWEKDRYITVNLTSIGSVDPELKDAYSYKIIYDNKPSKIVPIGKTVKLDTIITKPDNEASNPIVTVELYKEDTTLIKTLKEIMLISSVELNAFDKSEYFEEYYRQFPTGNGLNLGEGIVLNKPEGNIYSGSIIAGNSNSSVSAGNWSIDSDRKIKARSIQLKNQLFYMGLAKDYLDLDSTTNIDDINDSTTVVDREYYNIDDNIAPVIKINDNVHFGSLTSKWEEKNGEVIILDTDINSTHVLGDGASNISGNFPVANLKGVIITNGNIIISGNLNFKGTIICNGDLTFEGTGDKRITYDKAYLENFALNNYQLFKDAFSDVGEYAKDNVNKYLFAKVYNNSNSTSSSDDKFKLIKRTKWELIK